MSKIKNFFIKIGTWFKNHAPSKRRIIQLYAALLYNANLKGFISGQIFTGETKKVCVPGLNCYSCPGAVGACPLGALQNALNASNKTIPYYMLGIIMLYGVIFARTICGFLCPIGLLQELLYKVKTPKIKKSKVTYVLTFLKWAILIVFVVALPIGFGMNGYANPGFCKYFCPAGTFGGGFILLINPSNANLFEMLGPLFTRKTSLLIVFIVMCMFMYRFFCRFFCPLGLIYGLFNRFSLLGVTVNKSKCTDCGLCVNSCKMDVRKVGDMECIQCGECISVCPENAIIWKGSKIFLHKDQLDPIASNIKIDIISNLPRIEPKEEEIKNISENETIQITEEVKPQLDEKTRKLIFKLNLENLEIAAKLKDLGIFLDKLNTKINDENNQNISPKEKERVNKKIDKLNSQINLLNEKFKINQFKVNELKKNNSIEIVTTPVKPGKKHLYDKKKTKIFFICLFSALSLVTATALIYYNFIDGISTEPPTTEPSNPSTNPTNPSVPGPTPGPFGVGSIPNNFSVDLFNSDETYTYKYDSFDGKIKIINFWATWCGPCVHELPYFNEIQANYKDEVEIIAIADSNETSKDVQDYIDKYFNTFNILFAHDNDGNAVFKQLGGVNSLPHTVILNQSNVCTFTKTGSMTYEAIESEITKLL